MAGRDPYQILGVSKSASDAEIKSAYRKLAKKLHPDVNQGRKDIESQFQEVSAAYDLLSDPQKRARYDRGEIDAQGQERGFSRGGYTGDPFSGMRGRRRGSTGGFDFGAGSINPEDIFAEFFGGAGPRARAKPERGADINYELVVPFIDACLGGRKRVTLSNQKTIDVTIPPGTEDGHKLRLRGLGHQGTGGNGDALVEIKVEPHAYFRREDNDIHLEAPVSLNEAVLGGTIKVPTLSGSVVLKIHKGANTGTVMRLKGKGVPRTSGEAGDMFVKLKVVLPDTVPDDLAGAIEKWAKKHPHDPRKKLGWSA